MDICQQRIAALWFIAAGAIFLLVTVQSIMGAYADPKDAFNWLVPNLLPTLSLMVGVFVVNMQGANAGAEKVVSPFMYRLTFWISATYLFAIVLTILLRPFSQLDALDLMKQAQLLWLAPLQGLVTASLGAFFVSAKKAT